MESVDHTFVECDVTASFWKKLFCEAGVVWSNILTKLDLLSGNPIVFINGKKAKILWGCGVLAVNWVVWMERNRRFFKTMVAQGWKSYGRVLNSGHPFGLIFLGSSRTTHFLLSF